MQEKNDEEPSLTEKDSIIDKEGLDHEVGDIEYGVETDNPIDPGIDEPLDDETITEPVYEVKEAIFDEELVEKEEKRLEKMKTKKKKEDDFWEGMSCG